MMHHRQNHFNKLVCLTARILQENLMELLFANKEKFTKLFCAPKAENQFEMSMCFNAQGLHDTDPTPPAHR
jgi:hypothetical protein